MPRNVWAGRDQLIARDYLILLAFTAGLVGMLAIIFLYLPSIAHFFEVMNRFMPHVGLDESPLLVIGYPLSIFGVWFVCIVVHELGHLLATLIMGYRVESILVWPFFVSLRSKKLSVKIVNQSDLAGFIGCVIQDFKRFRLRYATVIFAGPFANLVLAAVSNHFRHQPSFSPFLHHTFTLTTLLSFWVGITGLIPRHSQIYSPDGSKLWMLAFQPERRERFMALIEIQNLSRAGQWSRDWPEQLINKALSSGAEHGSEKYALFWYGYIWASAKEKVEFAAECLERCLEASKSAGPVLRDSLAMKAAIFQAWHRQSREKALAWKNHVKNEKGITKFDKTRLRICMSCLENDFQAALRELDELSAEIEKLGTGSMAEKIKRAFQEWRAQIEQRAALSKAATRS